MWMDIHMAAHPHSFISAVAITTATIAANPKLSLLRPRFSHQRYAFRPTTPFLTRNASVDVHNQRPLLLPPPRAFTVDVSGHLIQDAGAAVVVVAGAYALVSGFDNLTQRQIIEQSLSRKLVHILSGLLYMGCWPIFSTSTDARYFAALVPLLNCARLLVHGLSLVTNEDLIKSVTREGKPEELLRGPLYYVLMLILSSIFFWRESPIGVISLSMMCGGDGIADIMGRRFGIHKIPYNMHKSWVGSISMFIVGFLISIGMLYYFSIFGYFELDWVLTIERVAMVALVATFVESLPTKGGLDDNISVPLVKLVSPSLMPKLGKAGSSQSRQAIVHSLVHTESWAIDLSWDIIARFGKQESMPRDFFDDFVRVAQDEGRHFTLLAARLEELGSFYGALPAHDGLWDSAVATSKDLFARIAIEHCVHEARGLDVLPTTISRFRNGGDNETAELLEKVVYPEEITHCAAGVKWFKYLCLRSKTPNKDEEGDNEVIAKFHEIVRTYFRGPLKPPFNESARRAAGFGPQWYEPLAVKDFF